MTDLDCVRMLEEKIREVETLKRIIVDLERELHEERKRATDKV